MEVHVVFSKILSALVLIFAVLYVGTLIAVYALPHFDYGFAEAGANNTALGITDGDSIVIKKTDLADITAGSVVAFTYQDYAYPAFLEVKTVSQYANKLTLYMDKEKNATMDVSYGNVLGVKVARLPHMAGVLAFMQNFIGKMLAAIITGAFIIIRFGVGFKRKGGLEL